MGLFGKKKEIRFETILIDREREVFRQLENRGWALCTDPFQFDVQKSHEKLRKDAMKMARELHAELLVEVWDPIYQHMHWKGLRFSAWRRATPEELLERQRNKLNRPDYSDTMGSLENIAQRLDQKTLKVDQEELHQYDSVLTSDISEVGGEAYGSSEEDMGMVTEHLDTVSSLNPYDYQGSTDDDTIKGSTIDREAARSSPVFDGEMQLQTGEPDSSDPTKEIDPLALMMQAAPEQERQPQSIPPVQIQQQSASRPSPPSPPPPFPQMPSPPQGPAAQAPPPRSPPQKNSDGEQEQ